MQSQTRPLISIAAMLSVLAGTREQMVYELHMPTEFRHRPMLAIVDDGVPLGFFCPAGNQRQRRKRARIRRSNAKTQRGRCR